MHTTAASAQPRQRAQAALPGLSAPVLPGSRWRGLRPAERIALACAPCIAAGLLLALVQACELSVQRGERLRAEQRLGAVLAAAPVAALDATPVVGAAFVATAQAVPTRTAAAPLAAGALRLAAATPARTLR